MKRKNLFKKDRVAKYDYIVSKEQPFSYISEAYQKGLVNLEYANIDNKLKVIQFTSTLAGAGKTTTISNIAYLLSNKGRKVVLIDLDLRKPKLNKVFNVPNENGLTDYLAGKLSYDKLINKSEELGINYIVSGEKTNSIINILEAQKLKDLISKLREDFDYILVDTPPVLAVSDSIYISRLVDGIVYVVAQNEAKRSLVNDSIKTLKNTGANIVGLFLTQVDFKTSDLIEYTYGYGYSYKPTEEE